MAQAAARASTRVDDRRVQGLGGEVPSAGNPGRICGGFPHGRVTGEIRALRSQPGRIVVTDISTGRVISGEREVSRETIMGRAASGFAALGVGAGDAISVVLRNDFPFFERAMQRSGSAPIACQSTGTARPPRLPMCCVTAGQRRYWRTPTCCRKWRPRCPRVCHFSSRRRRPKSLPPMASQASNAEFRPAQGLGMNGLPDLRRCRRAPPRHSRA